MDPEFIEDILTFKPESWQGLSHVADLKATYYLSRIPDALGELKHQYQQSQLLDWDWMERAVQLHRMAGDAKLVSSGADYITIKNDTASFAAFNRRLSEAHCVGSRINIFVEAGRRIVSDAHYAPSSDDEPLLTLEQMKFMPKRDLHEEIVADQYKDIIESAGGFKAVSKRLTSLLPSHLEMVDIVAQRVGFWPSFADQIFREAIGLT
jgi:hypothetical protein